MADLIDFKNAQREKQESEIKSRFEKAMGWDKKNKKKASKKSKKKKKRSK